jgi:hypothetical protein
MNRSYSKIRHIQETNEKLEKRILSEQVKPQTVAPTFNSEIENFAKQGNQQIEQTNIETRFGLDFFNKVKSLADKMGLKQLNNINEDNSYYMWGKDLREGNKLILILANERNDNPTLAYVATYVDRDNGTAGKVERGQLVKGNGKMGTYPSWDYIIRGGVKIFDRIEPEMIRISKFFQ